MTVQYEKFDWKDALLFHQDLFHKATMTVQYEKFDWKDAPFNSFEFAISMSLLYTALCLMHNFLSKSEDKTVKDRKDTKDGWIKAFLPMHNLILCLGSLIMLLGTGFEVMRRIRSEHGFHWMFCEEVGKRATGPLFFWSYLYYLSKFYELLDTILQLLQGKKPPHYFLHAYHHACVIMMCWCWLEYCPTLTFIGILFNTFVHVVMYYYFYLRSIGTRVIWWKSYVTIVQIVQFMTSGLCFLVTMFFIHMGGESCNGNTYLYLCIAFNMSLLFGFVNVLSVNNKRDGQHRKAS